MKKKTTAANILRNPFTILLFITLGIYVGINYPVFSGGLQKYGEIYINILKLFALPVFITAVISGISNLSRFPKFKNTVGKIIFLIVLFGFISSALGIITGLISKPGVGITQNIQSILESNAGYDNVVIDKVSVLGRVSSIIADNIFYSLSSGNLLQILLFTVLISVAIGYIKNSQSDFLFEFFDGLFLSLQKVMNWLAVLLPIGLFCIISSQMSLLNIESIKMLLKFIYSFYGIGLFSFIAGVLIIWQKSGQRFLPVLKNISKPVLIGLSTKNSLISLPYSIFSMNRELKFDKETINMYLPIGLTIGQFGNMVFYSLTSIFITQMYSVELNITSILVIFITSIFIGLLSAGTSGLTTITLLSITLDYFSIPMESVFLILLVADILIEPIRVLLTVVINLICTSILGKSHTYIPEEVELGVVMQNLPDNINLRTYFRDLEEEIPLIDQDKTELISAVFPNATFKKYKNWDLIEELWNSYEVNLVIGEKDLIRNISKDISDDSKFVVLKPRI